MLQMCPLETVAIVQSEDLSGKLFPGTDFQRRGPEVLVLYLKRPRVKIYRSDALCTGASDTAT